MASSNLRGIFPITTAAVIWGVYFLVAKILGDFLSPLQITFWTAFLNAAPLLILQRHRIRRYRTLPSKYWGYVVGLSLTWNIGTYLCILSLNKLDLTVFTLLEKAQPFFTVLLAAIFLNERFHRRSYVWFVLATAGSYLVAVSNPLELSVSNDFLVGLFAVLSGALCYASGSIFGKQLITNDDVDPVDVVVLRFTLSSLLLLPAIAVLDGFFPPEAANLKNCFGLLALSFLSWPGHILYYRGLKNVTATIASFIELITPMVGVALGMFVLGESLTSSQYLGIPLLLIAVHRISRINPVAVVDELT